jgi:hypothetical protein
MERDLVSSATKEYGRRIERLSALVLDGYDLAADILGALSGVIGAAPLSSRSASSASLPK